MSSAHKIIDSGGGNNLLPDFHPVLGKRISKHRHVEPEYWTNKFKRRDKLARIQKQSRKINAR